MTDDDAFRALHADYLDGNGLALLDAVRIAMGGDEPRWVWEEVHKAITQWNSGETREFAEPWGLVRVSRWRQQKHTREMAPRRELNGMSLVGAVVLRVHELHMAGAPLSDPGAFDAVASEFDRFGVSASQARKWWYSEGNILRPRDSQESKES